MITSEKVRAKVAKEKRDEFVNKIVSNGLIVALLVSTATALVAVGKTYGDEIKAAPGKILASYDARQEAKAASRLKEKEAWDNYEAGKESDRIAKQEEAKAKDQGTLVVFRDTTVFGRTRVLPHNQFRKDKLSSRGGNYYHGKYQMYRLSGDVSGIDSANAYKVYGDGSMTMVSPQEWSGYVGHNVVLAQVSMAGAHSLAKQDKINELELEKLDDSYKRRKKIADKVNREINRDIGTANKRLAEHVW